MTVKVRTFEELGIKVEERKGYPLSEHMPSCWMVEQVGESYLKGYGNQGRKKGFSLFKCHCGETFESRVSYVISGETSSCGCLGRSISSKANVTHGVAATYGGRVHSWAQNARHRCELETKTGYESYGGRGIKFRFDDLMHYVKHMEQLAFVIGYGGGVEEALDAGMSVDRIDVDGHYEPGNVRWATKSEQNNNQRRHKKA